MKSWTCFARRLRLSERTRGVHTRRGRRGDGERKEALATQRRYLDLLQSLSAISASWPVIPQIDQGPDGPLPRINLSVKASALCARFDPLDPDSEKSSGNVSGRFLARLPGSMPP